MLVVKIRLVITFLNTRKVVKPTEIHPQLVKVYGNNVTTVQRVRK